MEYSGRCPHAVKSEPSQRAFSLLHSGNNSACRLRLDDNSPEIAGFGYDGIQFDDIIDSVMFLYDLKYEEIMFFAYYSI